MAYRKFHFKDEPFRHELEVPMRGRDREWKKITSFLETGFEGNRVRSYMIIGDYGFGKTFFLNKIREEMDNPQSSIVNADKTICVTLILAETEPASSISYEYVTSIFKNIGEIKLYNICQNLPPNFESDKFSRKFNKIITSLCAKKREAYYWLIGESLTSNEKKAIDLTRKFHPNESLTIFMDFLKLLKMCGIENLLVLIDEFEYAINVYSEIKLTSLFHTFKNIFDKYVEGKGSITYAKQIQIIAITPKGYDFIDNLEKRVRARTGGGGITPWMERMRFEINQLSLGPLSKAASIEILKHRIQMERMKYKEVAYETFPFVHPSFFNKIVELSEKKPRYLLDYSEIVLEEAARKNLPEIDGKVAEQILKEYGIV